jgi:hypothetical protein
LKNALKQRIGKEQASFMPGINIRIKRPVFFRVCGAVEKPPSAALRSPFITAAYEKVRLILHDFARLASECF